MFGITFALAISYKFVQHITMNIHQFNLQVHVAHTLTCSPVYIAFSVHPGAGIHSIAFPLTM